MSTKIGPIMKEKQNYYPDEFNAAIKTANGINGKSQSNGNSYAINGEKRISLNPLMLRLQKMETINTNLLGTLDQRTKELAEVVDANTKSISVIAHDLRSPFCAALMALELLKDNLDHNNAGEIEHFIKSALGSVNSAINLLDNLVEWAMLQNNGLKINPVRINLQELVRSEVEKLSTVANQKQINLNFSITPDLYIDIDIQMARIILRNLINNAIKFTDEGGEISVSARECHPYVEIEVTDNGIGISPENQKRIFKNENIHLEPQSRNRQGSGLGLKLCREFAEMHGGHISVKSKLGKGSKFKFSLPVRT